MNQTNYEFYLMNPNNQFEITLNNKETQITGKELINLGIDIEPENVSNIFLCIINLQDNNGWKISNRSNSNLKIFDKNSNKLTKLLKQTEVHRIKEITDIAIQIELNQTFTANNIMLIFERKIIEKIEEGKYQ